MHANSTSRRHSFSFKRHAKHAMTAASLHCTRISKSWTMKKFAILCVMFSKRSSSPLTPLQCMAWTGRRDKRALPICLFDMAYLTSNLDAYKKSCDSLATSGPTPTGSPSVVTLRSLAVFDGMVRFVFPLCSLIRKRPSPETPIFQATVIADISGVSLIQIWRIRSWLQTFCKVELPQPIFSLFNQIGSTKTLSRCSRAPPKRILLTKRNTIDTRGCLP